MKDKLARQWDKAALIASVALVLAYFIVGVAMAKPNPMLRSAEDSINDLETALGDGGTAKPDPLHARERAEADFAAPVEAKPGDEWVYYKATKITVESKDVQVVATGPDPVFGKPVQLKAETEVGRVRLSWADAEGINLAVAGYHVYRRRKGDKDFARVVQDVISDKSYVDEAVEPKATYDYAVSAVASKEDEKFAEAVKRNLFKPDGESARSDPQSVTTKGVIGIALKIVSEMPPSKPDEDPVRIARVTVKKFIGSDWETRDYQVKKGDKIGGPVTISRGGRPVKIDFTTNYEVLDIDKAEKAEKRPKEIKKFDDKGRVVGVETVIEEVKVMAWCLTYKDDEGKKQKVFQEEAAKPAPKPAAKEGEKKPAEK